MSCVLVVEDNDSVRTALARGLRSAGIEGVFASTLSEGIEKLDGCTVALVDLDLPDGLGVDLLQFIRQMPHPVRVAICSGTPDVETVVAASGQRPDALFRKPLDLDRLVAWIRG